MYNQATVEMNNPLSPVKNVREMYCKFLQRVVTEVQVQFKDEEPAWIPYDTLLAIKECEIEFQERIKNGNA
tara:strand:- start:40 stop:252 length:213 start_codon:yes stop_codon:yes gene_type:complete